MIIIGSRVTIVPSGELSDMQLNPLLGEKGLVAEDLTDNEGAGDGYMVLFSTPFKGECLWFIPKKSVHEQG